MKIIAAVPTYNRPELLIKNIVSLLNQTRKLDLIVIVDNASDEATRNILYLNGYLSHEYIKYVRLDVNVGASGGFKKAMEIAISEGADWIWGMDDDAFPRDNALEELEKHALSGVSDCFWSTPDEDFNYIGEYKIVDHLIFVGFFLSRKLVEKVGMPDTRFYMYHDDTDYSNRITENGYKIYKIKSSIIDHKGFDKRGENPVSIKKILFFKTSILNCEPYRLYYIYRNSYYINNSNLKSKLHFLIYYFLGVIKYFFYRRDSVKYILIAGLDIIKGIRGKTI